MPSAKPLPRDAIPARDGSPDETVYEIMADFLR